MIKLEFVFILMGLMTAGVALINARDATQRSIRLTGETYRQMLVRLIAAL